MLKIRKELERIMSGQGRGVWRMRREPGEPDFGFLWYLARKRGEDGLERRQMCRREILEHGMGVRRDGYSVGVEEVVFDENWDLFGDGRACGEPLLHRIGRTMGTVASAVVVDPSGGDRGKGLLFDLEKERQGHLGSIPQVLASLGECASVALGRDAVLYTRYDELLRAVEAVRFDGQTHEVVLDIRDRPELYLDVFASKDGTLLGASASSRESHNVYLWDDTDGKMKEIAEGGMRCYVESWNGGVLLLTDVKDVGGDLSLLWAEKEDVMDKRWMKKNKLVLDRVDEVCVVEKGVLGVVGTEALVFSDGRRLELQGVSAVEFGGNLDVKRESVRCKVSFPHTLPKFVDVDVVGGVVLNDDVAFGDEGDESDESSYAAEVIKVKSSIDGVKIPVTMVSGVGVPKSNVLIHVYGAYGVPLDASLDVAWAPLLDRGWTIASAHIRGGGEFGHRWYEAGRGEHRHVSIQDAVDVARHLRNEFHGSVCIRGSSAGAVPASHCVLEGGLIDKVVYVDPFLGVAASMQDDSAPLTSLERQEWGPLPYITDRICPTVTLQRHHPNLQHPLPPALFLYGSLDERVNPAHIETFASLYESHGGFVRLHPFEGGHSGPNNLDAVLEHAAIEADFLCSKE